MAVQTKGCVSVMGAHSALDLVCHGPSRQEWGQPYGWPAPSRPPLAHRVGGSYNHPSWATSGRRGTKMKGGLKQSG